MKKKILAGLIMVFTMALVPVSAWAEPINVGGHSIEVGGGSGKDICDSDNVDDEAKKAAGCGEEGGGNEIGSTVQNVISVVIAVLGIVAVIFVIIGGAQYMLSRGDPAKTKKAKDTILYAILGVILAAAAYAIVNFVLASVFKGEG